MLIATKPVDFCKGIDGFTALVKEHPRADAFSGAISVFRAKRADRVKLIAWDNTGLCLLAKCLEQSTFRWPRVEDGTIRLTPAQLSALIEGLDWTQVQALDVRPPGATQLVGARHVDSDSAVGAPRGSRL